MQRKKDKVTISPETKIIRGIMSLLKKNQAAVLEKNPEYVEKAATAEFQLLLPKIVAEWQQADLQRSLMEPLNTAMKERQPERVLEVFYRSPRAMSLLQKMHDHWKTEAAAKPEQPAPAQASDVKVGDEAKAVDTARTS